MTSQTAICPWYGREASHGVRAVVIGGYATPSSVCYTATCSVYTTTLHTTTLLQCYMPHHPICATLPHSHGRYSFFGLNEYFFELNPRKNPVLNIFFELNPRKKSVLNNIFELNFFINPKMNNFLNWIFQKKKVLNNFWIEYFWKTKFWIFFELNFSGKLCFE